MLPPEELRVEVAARWRRVLKLDELPPRADFIALGGSSLQALTLLHTLETELGLAVPLVEFVSDPTLDGLLARLRPQERSPLLVALNGGGSRPPFFFMHAGSGRAAFAAPLAAALGPEQPFYGLESRGLEGEEAPLRAIEPMARLYVEALRGVQARGPYRVGGFCMGALLALEVACQLQDAGEEVSHLLVFSTDARWKRTRGLAEQLALHADELRGRGPGGTLGYLRRRVRFRAHRLACRGATALVPLYAALGRKLPPRLRELAVAEHNQAASWRYRPRRFRGRVRYFQGEDEGHRDPLPFWAPLADAVDIRRVPGEFDTMFAPPAVAGLADAVAEVLAEAAISRPPRTTRG